VGNKIGSYRSSIREPGARICLEKINNIGPSFDDGGGVKKFCVKVRTGEPKFSGF
jgi:hypothetical protein